VVAVWLLSAEVISGGSAETSERGTE
jgi:hypothetical protein